MLFITKVEITVCGATDIVIITISISTKLVVMSVHGIFTIVFGAVLFCHTFLSPIINKRVSRLINTKMVIFACCANDGIVRVSWLVMLSSEILDSRRHFALRAKFIEY